MYKKSAQLLSYLLHPAVYPLLGTLVLLYFGPFYLSVKITLLALLLVFVGTYILPVTLSYLLYRLNVIHSLEMKTANERRVPYLVGTLCYYLVSILILQTELPSDVHLYILASTVVIGVHLVCLRFMKPSAHMAGIGGFTGLLLALSFEYHVNFIPILSLCFLLAGLVASARLYLKAHNPSELIFGYFSGLFIVGLMIYLA